MENKLTQEQKELTKKLEQDSGEFFYVCTNFLVKNEWDYNEALKDILSKNPKCPKCKKHMKKSSILILDATRYICNKHGAFTQYHRTGAIKRSF